MQVQQFICPSPEPHARRSRHTHAFTCYRCNRERSSIPLYPEHRYGCIGTGLTEVCLCEETSLVIGTEAKRRYIPLGSLYNAVGDCVIAALPGFHAFRGCDQTGTLCGESKISRWNAFKKVDEHVLEAFARLGSSAHVEDEVSRMLELYMCRLYLPSVHVATAKELRWFLLNMKQYADEKLPPTKAALQQMIQRANYVALVWKECGSPHPDLPAPTSHGLSQDGEQLQAIPTTLPPAPKAVLELVKCGCRGSCTNLSYSCRKHSLKCTDMCGS